jgi:UDP-glucose 4-epimerase
MKVVVTGGAGFVGSHVVEHLIDAGHEVVVLDSLVGGKRSNVHPGARLREVDIRDGDAVKAAFAAERPEVVSHQAAQASVKVSMENPLLDAQTNIIGTINILEACRAHGVRKVVYAGTGGAAVGEPKYLPVDEAHPAEPLSIYGADKYFVEHYCRIYRDTWGMDITRLRYANVYGPRQDPFGEAGVIAIFARRMLDNGDPIVNGDGEQERDYVYVGDIARANLLAIEKGGAGPYHLGTGVGTSVNTLFDRLAELTGYGKPRRHGPAMPGEVFRIFLDISRARAELGWEPQIGLDEGLRRTVESVRAEA